MAGRLQALLIAALLLAGCATAGGGGTRIFGVVGFDGDALILDMRGTALPLRGPPDVEDQLRRLESGRVAIRGSASRDGVVAREFELLEAPDGLPPYVGRLIVDQSGVMLQDEVSGHRLALRGPELARLKRNHGARIWVTGSLTGDQLLLLAHWGLLIPAP